MFSILTLKIDSEGDKISRKKLSRLVPCQSTIGTGETGDPSETKYTGETGKKGVTTSESGEKREERKTDRHLSITDTHLWRAAFAIPAIFFGFHSVKNCLLSEEKTFCP